MNGQEAEVINAAIRLQVAAIYAVFLGLSSAHPLLLPDMPNSGNCLFICVHKARFCETEHLIRVSSHSFV